MISLQLVYFPAESNVDPSQVHIVHRASGSRDLAAVRVAYGSHMSVLCVTLRRYAHFFNVVSTACISIDEE